MFAQPKIGAFILLILQSATSFAEGVAVESEVGALATQPSEHFGQIILSLVLVLLVIFLSAWLLRRYSRFPGVADGNLKVIGALSAGPREKIMLLQVGKEQVLVGVTSAQITTLLQLEDTVELKDNVPVTSQFSQRLQEALKSKDSQATSREDN